MTADERRSDDALLTLDRPEERISKLGGSVSHTERRAPCAVLSFYDFVASILNPVHERLPLLAALRHCFARGRLREEGHDGDARVTAHDGDRRVKRVCAGDAGEEARGTDDVEGGDTEELPGVEGAGFGGDGGYDRDGRVDGVGDDEDVCIRRDTGNGGREVANDACISLKGNEGAHKRKCVRHLH